MKPHASIILSIFLGSCVSLDNEIEIIEKSQQSIQFLFDSYTASGNSLTISSKLLNTSKVAVCLNAFQMNDKFDIPYSIQVPGNSFRLDNPGTTVDQISSLRLEPNEEVSVSLHQFVDSRSMGRISTLSVSAVIPVTDCDDNPYRLVRSAATPLRNLRRAPAI